MLQVSKTGEVGHTFFRSIWVNLKCIAPIVQKNNNDKSHINNEIVFSCKLKNTKGD